MAASNRDDENEEKIQSSQVALDKMVKYLQEVSHAFFIKKATTLSRNDDKGTAHKRQEALSGLFNSAKELKEGKKTLSDFEKEVDSEIKKYCSKEGRYKPLIGSGKDLSPADFKKHGQDPKHGFAHALYTLKNKYLVDAQLALTAEYKAKQGP